MYKALKKENPEKLQKIILKFLEVYGGSYRKFKKDNKELTEKEAVIKFLIIHKKKFEHYLIFNL